MRGEKARAQPSASVYLRNDLILCFGEDLCRVTDLNVISMILNIDSVSLFRGYKPLILPDFDQFGDFMSFDSFALRMPYFALYCRFYDERVSTSEIYG